MYPSIPKQAIDFFINLRSKIFKKTFHSFITMKKIAVLFLISVGFQTSFAQTKKPIATPPAPANPTAVSNAHAHSRVVNVENPKTGLQTFIWHDDANKLPKATEGNQYPLHARLYSADGQTLLNDYNFMNNVPCQRQNFGFMYDGILKMAPGDSAIFKVASDSMFGKQLPPFTKSGESVCFSFVMYTKEAGDKIVEEKKKAQVGIDEKKLKQYFQSHGITQPIKTKEGLYYIITEQGTGEMPKAGNDVVVNYTGRLLDGTTFDSNVDTTFHHVQPFKFGLGKKQVIQGWDLGFANFKKGTKALLFIPSYLAYGEQAPPGGKIKPNDVLTFEVELVDIVEPMDPTKQFDKYFAENKIKAEKTPEGLYYVITQPGTGDKPKAGQTVIANYTGKLLSGKKFDSNMEEEFHHVQPFSFALGQHMVITGWDLGFGLLNKGAKATLYIPSNLAYGENGQGPIPANSPLIFDVELVDIK